MNKSISPDLMIPTVKDLPTTDRKRFTRIRGQLLEGLTIAVFETDMNWEAHVITDTATSRRLNSRLDDVVGVYQGDPEEIIPKIIEDLDSEMLLTPKYSFELKKKRAQS